MQNQSVVFLGDFLLSQSNIVTVLVRLQAPGRRAVSVIRKYLISSIITTLTNCSPPPSHHATRECPADLQSSLEEQFSQLCLLTLNVNTRPVNIGFTTRQHSQDILHRTVQMAKIEKHFVMLRVEILMKMTI